MSLTNTILLTLVNTAICLALPKLIYSVFAVKHKPSTLSQTSAIALKNQAETV